ncbi:MAG: type III-B CRISPR-associated protein Cas10/Cmr2, partial [Chloracidobacterium sp.]
SLNVANKVVALVPAGQAPELARKAAQAVRERVAALATEAFQRLGERFDRDVALRQARDLPEVTWATAVVGDGGYGVARDLAERALAARKTLRDFAPVDWGSARPKSSLDGLRESVLRPGQADELLRAYGIRRSEQLCGVGLMKRLGQRGRQDGSDRVSSTSHMAALPVLEQLSDNDMTRQAARTFFKVLRDDLKLSPEMLGKTPVRHPVFENYDGRLLFESRYGEFFEDEPDVGQRRAKVQTAAQVLRSFLRQSGLGRPYPYYGLLLADGDHMGAAIDACQTPEAHRKLSQALAAFASEARQLVEEQHRGSLMYAGGDDVLAYVPLHTALDCAEALATAFQQRLAGVRPAEVSPTLSVGLAVSHHLDPLEDALRRARRAEQVAKRTRNALVIAFDKRSGGETVVGGRWGDFDQQLKSLIDLYRQGALAHGAAYELRRLALQLNEAEAEPAFQAALRQESLRILRRKRDRQGRAISDATLGVVEAALRGQSVGQLADALVVAREFERVSRAVPTAVSTRRLVIGKGGADGAVDD